jgi:hypothetical protein
VWRIPLLRYPVDQGVLVGAAANRDTGISRADPDLRAVTNAHTHPDLGPYGGDYTAGQPIRGKIG